MTPRRTERQTRQDRQPGLEGQCGDRGDNLYDCWVVLSVTPDADVGDFGWTYTVTVMYRGQEREIRASEGLYAQLYSYLDAGHTHLRVLVIGQGRDKRYAVEAL